MEEKKAKTPLKKPGTSTSKPFPDNGVYDTIFDLFEDGFILATLDLRILKCNHAMCRLLGYTLKEILGKRFDTIFPERLMATIPDILAKYYAGGDACTWLEGRTKDDRVFYSRISSQMVRIGKGRYVLIRFHRAPEKGVSSLEEVHESCPLTKIDLPSVYNITWRKEKDDFVMASCTMISETGMNLPVNTLVGKKASEIYTDNTGLLKDLMQCVREKKTFKRQKAFSLFNSHETRTVINNYMYSSPSLVIEHTVDISGLKQAVDALRERQQYLMSQYLFMPIPTLTWRKEGEDFVLVDFNFSAHELSCGHVSDHVGNSLNEIYGDHPDILDDFRWCMRERSVIRREVPYNTLRVFTRQEHSSHMSPEDQDRIIQITCAYVVPDLVVCHMEEITEQKAVESRLRHSHKSMKILSEQLIVKEEQIRRRIARDIHDSIGQCLSMIKFSNENCLKMLSEQGITEGLDPLKASIPMIKQAIGDVKRIIMDLRPPMLDDLGILATLSWISRTFKETYLDINIETKISIEEKDINDQQKTAIYRIVQEALNNAARHSFADRVQVCLKRMSENIELVIRDNGMGFHMEEISKRELTYKGMGLASMRERAELSGGTFSVISKGKGTTIRVVWPA